MPWLPSAALRVRSSAVVKQWHELQQTVSLNQSNGLGDHAAQVACQPPAPRPVQHQQLLRVELWRRQRTQESVPQLLPHQRWRQPKGRLACPVAHRSPANQTTPRDHSQQVKLLSAWISFCGSVKVPDGCSWLQLELAAHLTVACTAHSWLTSITHRSSLLGPGGRSIAPMLSPTGTAGRVCIRPLF